MKLFNVMFVVVITAFLLGACGNEDELAGTWEIYEMFGGPVVEEDASLTFTEDGSEGFLLVDGHMENFTVNKVEDGKAELVHEEDPEIIEIMYGDGEMTLYSEGEQVGAAKKSDN
ncbi:hypothetical protein [Evansella cellulosilytica]|uniref:Lipocalin-like domain-containing protein n=1 Tax=Evansella cellulosilytica (strain ATCC 21833 / DSM 2522 / FERM P-1141 / JCM 9156 / N-4) TaxID=649639 RepID=E6TTY8_EVAC2|nr:hypothetical protein [Evansella cellulosilytica]ADU32019.1 hypothetical protein Bcell_3779 [Evansella cellulosilytica DSM 2522]